MTRLLLTVATAAALAAPATSATAASCPENALDCVAEAVCGLGCAETAYVCLQLPTLPEYCVGI